MFPIQTVLCGWYVYLAVLSVLLSLSAGRGTWLGWLGLLSAVANGLTLTLLYGWVSLPAMQWATLVVNAVPLVVGLLALGLAPRQDTKLIGLLLAGAAALPVYLHFAG